MQPTKRFSGRVNDYTKYRPGYPPECIRFMQDTFSINKNTVIADIGSGTGILTRLLMETGAVVFAVEPNDEMRLEAEQQAGPDKKKFSINGTGEDTHLIDRSIDLITVAQAFHWMNAKQAKKEFRRILKPGGHTALIWNIQPANTPFARDYEKIKETYGKDYIAIRKSHEPDLATFFHPRKHQLVKFPHYLLFDEEALRGQIRSSSFMPAADEPDYDVMSAEITSLFHKHQENGLVKIYYETHLHFG